MSRPSARRRRIRPASDVYALATLGTSACAVPLRSTVTARSAVLIKQQSQAVPPLLSQRTASAVPPPLAQFIERNLSKAPAERSPDARSLRVSCWLQLRVGLDPGLPARTRRGYAVVVPAINAGSPPVPAVVPVASGNASRLFVLACFVLGASVALGVAAKPARSAKKRHRAARARKLARRERTRPCAASAGSRSAWPRP